MTRSLKQALHLSAQPSPQKTSVIPKLFHLDLPLRKLVLETPILQAWIMARGCTKVATSSIDASVAGVGVLIAGRVAGGVMAGVVATVLDSLLPAIG